MRRTETWSATRPLVASMRREVTSHSKTQNAWRAVGGAMLIALVLGLGHAAQVDPDLIQRLAAASPGQKFPVDFILTAQANALDLDASIANLPKPERRARVGRVLMDFAQTSQSALLSWLRTKETEGKVDGIAPLWIVNAVGCYATPDVILEVAQRPDIGLVYYDPMPCDAGRKSGTVPAISSDEIRGCPDFRPKPEPVPCDGIEPQMIVTNVRGAWNQGAHGQNTVIGIVDTGVRYTHADLLNHLWTSAAYPNCGFNFASFQYTTHRNRPGPSSYDTLTPLDFYGHGTFRAGVATADGAYGDASHDTMGIAPAAKIMSLPVDVYLYSPYPDTSTENNVMDAYQFCIRPPRDSLNGADVIYTGVGMIASWLPRYAVWRAAQENILAAGLVNFVTGGADGPAARTIRCPGNCPPPWPNPANNPTSHATSGVITVGCTDNNDNLASFSSCGPSDWGSVPPYNDYVYPPGLTDPDVVMPGVNVNAPYYTDDQSYTTMSGTSISTAGAAGVACLMLSKNPLLSPREIDSILELYAVIDLGPTGKDNTFGAGRINCSLAVAFAPGGPVGISTGSTTQPLKLEAWPNPFADRVSLQLTADNSRPEVHIYDVAGQLVRTLQLTGKGRQTAVWDGRNDAGRRVAPGCYFCRATISGQSVQTKLLMTR